MKSARIAAGLSLTELARRAGLNVGYLIQHEEGRPIAPIEAERIATVLSTTVTGGLGGKQLN